MAKSVKHIFLSGLMGLLSLLPRISSAQEKDWNSSQIKLELDKLRTLGSVLYVAAHPDDENTRLISYLANDTKARTAYLSLTRGDGGQNLIGTEKGALMGLLRTHELLEARKIDGGEQYFTRAVDFGYSKNPEETFTKWDKKQVLADVVWRIRKFQPDVIITRFPPNSRAGHGHHTASAMLAAEAFELAADPTAFPEQLKYVTPWQAKRHFFNSSTWWDKELATKAAGNDSIVTADIGKFNPLLGKSYSEIASESRSMHKSQGFGSGKRRGTRTEYLTLKQGPTPSSNSIFDGIETNWNRLENSKGIQKMADKLYADFDPTSPSTSVAGLIKLYNTVKKLPESNWSTYKLKQIEKLIVACSGVWLEATTGDYGATPKEEFNVSLECLIRSDLNMKINKVSMAGKDTTLGNLIENNQPFTFKTSTSLHTFFATNPYWLNDPYEGMFQVEQPTLIGIPTNSNALPVQFDITIEGVNLSITRPLMYKWTDPVKAEIYREFVVLPPVTANITDPVYLFASDQPQQVGVTVRSNSENASGKIQLKLPNGWKSEPASINYQIDGKYVEKMVYFEVTPPKDQQTAHMSVEVWQNGIKDNARSFIEIDYDHIPKQVLLPQARSTIVKVNVSSKGKKVGYIEGAGDEVPTSLKQLGYEVELITEENFRSLDLSKFDVIMTGVRAYNTKQFLKSARTELMNYVENGGNLVVQYNTSHRLVTKEIGPYDMKLSRDRVTVEEAKATFISPEHPVLNYPNKITQQDFEGWVQERGLYFPNEWDERYTPIISWNDPEEDEKQGALLVAEYGKGHFVYTGISFFRELPAGVPGAYRLMANILSLGKK